MWLFWLTIGAGVGALVMAMIAGAKCGDMQRQIEYEKNKYFGDTRALVEELKSVRQSNKALRSYIAIKKAAKA